MQSRQKKRENESSHRAADRDLVGDDEMLEVNERGGNQAREERALDECERRRLPAKRIPARKERQAGEQFHEKVAR